MEVESRNGLETPPVPLRRPFCYGERGDGDGDGGGTARNGTGTLSVPPMRG